MGLSFDLFYLFVEVSWRRIGEVLGVERKFSAVDRMLMIFDRFLEFGYFI